MHNAEGIKSTPRTADGLCRRVTINVHRPDTAAGAPGENKPEKVDLYKCATPQQACGQREIVRRGKFSAPYRAAAAPRQAKGARRRRRWQARRPVQRRPLRQTGRGAGG